MGIEQGYNIINGTFGGTRAISTNLAIPTIIPLTIVIVTLFIITRNTSKMKVLAFPVVIMYNIIGLKQHIITIIATALIFALETMNITGIDNLITSRIRAIEKKPNPTEQLRKRATIIQEAIEKARSKR